MADIFLNPGETLPASAISHSRFFGNSGSEAVGLGASARGVTIAQTVEKITLPAPLSGAVYFYQQQGNQLVVFDQADLATIARITVRTDSDGTALAFDNGLADLHVGDFGMILVGQRVPSDAPGRIVPPPISYQLPMVPEAITTQSFG